MISIHAPLTGSDDESTAQIEADLQFQSTLPLRGATYFGRFVKVFLAFQSTLPLRGATVGVRAKESKRRNFNPRSPYGERLGAGTKIRIVGVISIHAPLTGSDVWLLLIIAVFALISIHAPLTGSDLPGYVSPWSPMDFNPRSPYGERPNADPGQSFPE